MSATDRPGSSASGSSKVELGLRERLAPVVAALGVDLEALHVARVGRRTLVKVVVDVDGGLELDDVADVSRAVEANLDSDDPFSGPFVLEVSSPGIDRPLTEPRHWRRNAGRLVQVEHNGEPLTARILSADDDAVTLRVDAERNSVQAPYRDLGPGRVQIEFNRPTSGPTAGDDDPQEG